MPTAASSHAKDDGQSSATLVAFSTCPYLEDTESRLCATIAPNPVPPYGESEVTSPSASSSISTGFPVPLPFAPPPLACGSNSLPASGEPSSSSSMPSSSGQIWPHSQSVCAKTRSQLAISVLPFAPVCALATSSTIDLQASTKRTKLAEVQF